VSLESNYREILENIENACISAGRKTSEIELVGVTKTVGIEPILKSIDMGISHIGENRVQEFLSKYDELKKTDVKMSIIGHLQTNKVKYIADKVDMIQSLDSARLAAEIDRQAKKHKRIIDVLLEINVGNEESKSGVSINELEKLIEEVSVYGNIRVRGLMSIPPILTDEKTQIQYFEKLYKVFIDIGAKKLDNIFMDFLSMGMSSDYPLAIKCGANMVRIGTSLYGKR